MVPTTNSRLTELLDQVRTEFESQTARNGEYEHKITQQMQEMDMVRQTVFQLENAHSQMKQKYEEEIAMLRRELEARGGSGNIPPHGNQNANLSQPPPPAIGLGPSNLFGTIMSQGSGQGGPGLAPPPPDSQQQQPPPHQIPPPNIPQIPQQTPQGPPQQQQGSQHYNQQGGFGVVNGKGPHQQGYQQPPPSTSPGPSIKKGKPQPAGTPVHHTHQSYQEPNRGSPHVARPSPAPIGNDLANLDVERMPADQKKEGPDWFAIYNPRVPRTLDVDLVHTLEHNSVVCCVRFSADGRYVATGCNRSAQIFDVKTGQKVQHLQDDSVEREGDLYIRSVCFSPDGRYLATGAEDKLIRVWDIASRTIKHTFVGHEQDIYSLDFARDGKHIASGSGDRTVRVWNIETAQNVLTLSIEDGVTTVAISPEGRYVAAGSLDKSVRVWDASTGYLVERLEGADGHKDSVYSVAFAPNGKDLVSGSLDKTIKMWELSAARGIMSGAGTSRGKCVKTFEGHKDFVLSVALTPDGNWVLSGSKDRGVQFWDPRTANAQLMLQGHKNSVISVAPSPIGGLFATGSGDMRARIWSYEPYMG